MTSIRQVRADIEKQEQKIEILESQSKDAEEAFNEAQDEYERAEVAADCADQTLEEARYELKDMFEVLHELEEHRKNEESK